MLASISRSAVKIHWTGKGCDKIVEGHNGETLLKIAERNKLPLPNACEGNRACATCQVYVNKGGDLLNEISDAEYDTLDYAVDLREQSRLACTCVLQTDDGEMDVVIPERCRNIDVSEFKKKKSIL
ncbi:Ferredoxin 7 [Trichomonas vaginalis G3]|uniref:Ferredoxin 7 n=1 Tax=Trichomonas vaginalis (strain ATCC PRA-98 / G3) TaxID=412133 RepID=A2G6S2_TRIV3|nr:2 iron, 2 sulfur cluster binding [Trichomonas vaginalis G3]EAX87148.1 Ferredoxin 7 [Trichomonas vaginalis G3]KAI5546962.1 2 iron, 2 sulfur cluster binding [Trichomonas vaginalis G3]|eukprot:XP_001300078.1 Ferredoxin 7 [Trichomonas vaginalis G3]